jgi:GNAT superfamily N-acetyltransferase
MSDVMVRLGTDVDVEAVVELWRELMAVHQAIAPMVWTLSEDAEERYRAHLADMMQDPNRRVFVAARQDEVVGYLVAEKGDRPPVLVPSTRGIFGEICVAPSARRAGVGRRLVGEAMRWFREEGLPMAEVGYATDNPMSVPFWEGLGFRPYQVKAVRSVESSG